MSWDFFRCCGQSFVNLMTWEPRSCDTMKLTTKNWITKVCLSSFLCPDADPSQWVLTCQQLDLCQNIFLSQYSAFSQHPFIAFHHYYNLHWPTIQLPLNGTRLPHMNCWRKLHWIIRKLWILQNEQWKLEWAASNGNRYPPYPQLMATAISQ